MRSWHAIGIFCEDIRQEKTGQSLMGIWPDNVNVPEAPGVFPRIGVYVRVHVEPSANVGAISGRLRFPDGSHHELGAFDLNLVKKTQEESRQKDAPWAGFVLTALAYNFPIQAEGRLLLLARIGDDEVVCGSLNVRVGTDANPSGDPSHPSA